MKLRILLVALAAAGGATAVVAGVLAASDLAGSWQHAARYTARFAFLVFVVVYGASAWHRLAPSAASRFAMRNRRSLGLAFATAHTVHLAALIAFLRARNEVPDVLTLVVGGGAFVTMYVLAATSTDAAVRRLGPSRWKKLHRFGVHYLWFVFAFTYLGRLAEDAVFFAPFAALAVGVFALRLVARRSRGEARPPVVVGAG
jgi:DMSO/TMAO reductase YedYZ heme-binding membrane subunit